MKKLTKKQHRGIIRDLINENQSVQNLRNIQRVAEIFEEEANIITQEGETCITADCIRLLLILIEENKEADAENALYSVYKSVYGDERDELYCDISEMMNELDDTRLRHVYFFIRGMLGKGIKR